MNTLDMPDFSVESGCNRELYYIITDVMVNSITYNTDITRV